MSEIGQSHNCWRRKNQRYEKLELAGSSMLDIKIAKNYDSCSGTDR